METKETRAFALGRALLLHLMSYGVREIVLYTLSLLPLGSLRTYITWGVTVLGAVAVYLLPTAYYIKKTDGVSWDIIHPLGARRLGKKTSATELIFAAAVTLCAVNLAGMLTDAVIGLLKLPAASARTLPDGIGLQLLFFISSVLIAPIAEEMLFRGAALNAYAPFGKSTAVLMSGLLFALMHYSFYSLSYAFCAGCVIAFFALRANSLLVAVGLHFLNNLIAFIILAVEKYAGVAASNTFGTVAFITCAAIAVVTAVVVAMKGGFGFDRTEKIAVNNSENNRAGLIKEAFCPEIAVYVLAAVALCICG